MLIGSSCAPLCLLWALVLLSSLGLTCITFGSRVQLIFLFFSLYPRGLSPVSTSLCFGVWGPCCLNSLHSPYPLSLSSRFISAVPYLAICWWHFAYLDIGWCYLGVLWSLLSFREGFRLRDESVQVQGLWLSGWTGRIDPPVVLHWSSVKIKTFGVFLVMAILRKKTGCLVSRLGQRP